VYHRRKYFSRHCEEIARRTGVRRKCRREERPPYNDSRDKENEMNSIVNIITGLVAFLHVYFLVLEMFLWDKPTGRKVFNTTEEFAAQSKTLAANQGLYNGFLAAGLIWGLFAGNPVKIFFLSCVIVAGIFGAFTVSKRIFYIQALPALVGLVLLLVI
jgi:putative membrane protein